MPRDWDAATYDRVAVPQFRWGAAVIERLELGGTERVLDAGCGSGRVTELLAERLPDGHVVALDASPSMLDVARARLERFGPRVSFVHADLMEPLPLEREVDAVVSTATFHWVPDHHRLFHHLAAVLRPGGRLVAQCGGAGNLRSVQAALARVGARGFDDKVFATADDTRARLESEGFVEVRCWLHTEPTTFDGTEDLATFLRAVALGVHVEDMAPEEADAFAQRVAEAMPRTELDYVRLNIEATRGADGLR